MEKLENKPVRFDKKIYISHGFQGKQDNIRSIEGKIKELRKEYPNYLFISPVHTFSYLYNDTEYIEGLEMCLCLMDSCDELWIIDKNYLESKGVVSEIIYAHENDIPVYHIL